MTQLELQAFLAVTRTGSFSQAAQSLFISQPALEPANPDPGGGAGLPPAGAAEGGPLGGAHPGGAGLHPCGGALARPVGGGPVHPPAGGKPGLSGRLRGQRVHLHPRPRAPALSADGTSSLTFHQYHSLESYGYVERGEVDLAFISDDMFRRQVETIPAFREPMRLVTRPGSPLPQHVHPSQLDSAREIRMQWNPEYDLWHAFWLAPAQSPACGSTRCP